MKKVICLLSVLFCVDIYALQLEFNIDITDTNALPSALVKAVNNAYELNMKGLNALDKKDCDAAMEYFNQALNALPEYDDALNNKGVAYFRKGLINDAKRIWEELASKNPDYATASYNLGLVYLHEHKYGAAETLFERALKANKNLVEAWVRYGYLQMQSGNKEKGLESLKKAYKISPDHKDAWSVLAHGFLMINDTVNALVIIKKKEPDPEALKMHGLIEAARKNYSPATDLLSRSVSQGADPNVLVSLASVQLDDNKCKNALETLKKYFTLSIAHEADAWLLGGIASKECGDYKQAEYYFEEGSRKYPQDAILQYNLAQIYFHQKKFDNAEEIWNDLSDTIQDPSLLYLRAMNARQKGKFDDAVKLITKAIGMDEKAEYYDFSGVVYHQKGDDKTATEQFRKALKISPELKSAQLNLALVTKTGQDFNSAARLLEQQLSACTSDSCADIALQLSIVYYHMKNVNKAISTLVAIKDADKGEAVCRHLAIYYKDQQEWGKAISVLETAAKNLILEPQTEYELAEAYLLAGFHSKAVDKFMGLIPKWTQNPWRLYYQIGYAHLDQNELVKAKEFFERSIKSKDNTAARGLLAFVLNRMGNVKDARQLWEKNLKDDPNNAALWINMGLSYERDGKYAEALEYYKKASMIKSDKELLINIGNAYMGLEKLTDALEAYSGALSSSKRDLAAYNIFLVAHKKRDKERALAMLKILEQEFSTSMLTRRANAEMNLWNGDSAGAIKILESISEKDNSDWLTLALLYALKNNKDKAKAYLAKVPNEPQWQKAIENVNAQIAFSSGNYDQALQILKGASDTSFSSQYNVALTAYNAKRFGDALSIATVLIQKAKGNDHADVCRLGGNSAFALKQWKTARQWYLQLSNLDVNNAIVQYNLAVASYNLNELDDSWKYYQRARSLNPSISNKDIENRYNKSKQQGVESMVILDSTDVWYNRAVDLQNTGSDSAAEMLYQKIVQKNPLYSLAWNNLGAIYGKRGDIDNAEMSYKKAVEKKHDIPETYANLVNLYIELEQFSKARQWLLKGIGHNPESELLAQMRERIEQAESAAQQSSSD